MSDRILLADDDRLLLDSVRFSLTRAGFDVRTAADSAEALAVARQYPPDLAILDIGLPDMDGLQLCRIMQTEWALPVIFLTAHDREMDIILGFDHGADDYITKPFSIMELVARVTSVLRRARGGAKAAPERFEVGDIVVDVKQHLVQANGQTVDVPPKEFNLLKLLVSRAGEVIDRQVLVDAIWGTDYFGDPRVLDVHIRWLREIIEADPANPTKIITVRGVGYKFQK